MTDRGRRTKSSFTSRTAHIFLYPIRLFSSVIAIALRPIAPQLIPFGVFFVLVPLLVIPAVVSGWYVWQGRAVSWESPLFFQYGDGLTPYAETQLTSFNPAQPYDISLHLVVPATQSNYDLGNFMTVLTLTDASNRILTTVRKPAIIMPPFYSRWRNPSTTTLNIPLLSRYVSGASRVVAKIELGRQDGWKSIGAGQGKELSVLTAFIEGGVRPQGVRGVISRFPLLSGVVASGVFLAVSFTVLAIFLIPSLWWRYGDRDPVIAKTEPSARSRVPPDALGEKRARKRSLKRSGSVGPVKREDYESSITALPSAESSVPLRRRRSRMSEPASDGE